jgi:hypothetical protein
MDIDLQHITVQNGTTTCKLCHGVSASYGKERKQCLVTFRLDEWVKSRLRGQRPGRCRGTAGTSENGEDPDPPFSGGSSLRVIRAIKKKWEEAKKAHGESGTLPSGSSTPHVALLRERLENSNFILVKIPIEIHNLGHGQRLICMDSDRLPEELGLNEEAIGSLVQGGLVRLRPQKPRPKKRIDYEALQQTYRRMLAEGGFASQTELARHLGVSGVRVSRVLKGIKRTTG